MRVLCVTACEDASILMVRHAHLCMSWFHHFIDAIDVSIQSSAMAHCFFLWEPSFSLRLRTTGVHLF